MQRNKTYNRRKILVLFTAIFLVLMILIGRLVYLMVFCSEYYGKKAKELHERERVIKAARGKIIDATGTVLATNRTVCTISVIHSQIQEPEKVIQVLSKELELSEETVRKRVEKVSSMERVKSNVDKATGDRIRAFQLAGVKVDEDYKRYYPYDCLASKVLGFTGGDNQGIIGLEVIYEEYLKGTDGQILTITDARGIEIENAGERRAEPIDGYNLHISLDYNIQRYAQQAAEKVKEAKEADGVSVIVMNPSNGQIMAMVNVPEFNLNQPFTITELQIDENPKEEDSKSSKENHSGKMNEEEKQQMLNKMWRNPCINDTYEPGSTFKIITAAATLEEGTLSEGANFFCPGFKIVEDRRIRCHKVSGHGAQDFAHVIMNSCNPAFIELGLRLGVDGMYQYFQQFGLVKKTGIDLPGEAGTIMHKKENVGQVELSTVSFGQSFQITPIQLVTTVSALINGGKRIQPHFGVAVKDNQGNLIQEFAYDTEENVISQENSKVLRELLEKVVSEGSGQKAYLEGYSIGGKTATSETFPRSANKYISSFLGFAPAEDPQVLALVIINNPQGVYYGGTIAAPVIQEIFSNILPYLGVEQKK